MATQGQIQPDLDFPNVQMPISTAEDDVIEVGANSKYIISHIVSKLIFLRTDLEPVTIPRHNAGPQELLQFFMALHSALYAFCSEALAGVDLELIKANIEDIYNQIWYQSGLKKCPAYMRDDNGRLMKSCLIFYPTKVG